MTNSTKEALSVRLINKGKHAMPHYATEHSAGMDLRANLDASITLAPGRYRLIPTGLFLELPEGTEAQVRPRSGLAFKHGSRCSILRARSMRTTEAKWACC
jgi:dUTP pyrophosphatase